MTEQDKFATKQHQNRQPGHEAPMQPQPAAEGAGYQGSDLLRGKVAIVTGGDSGIGRAVAIAFAHEGADVVVSYLDEHEDARKTEALIAALGRRCLLVAGDIGDPAHAKAVVEATRKQFGKIDVLVNNAGEQHPQDSPEAIEPAQLERTFRTNIFAMFYLVQHALAHMGSGSAIVNTASVTAYKGSPRLLDYSATKGAIVAYTRSLSQLLVEKNIRVNAVAPGPIWTPLIAATFTDEQIEKFGKDVPMKRPGQPDEVAHAYVFLASDRSSYMTGQVLHPNGGSVVNG